MEIDATNEKLSNIKWSFPTSYTIALLSWTTGLSNIFCNPIILLEIGFFNYLLVHSVVMVIIGIPMTLIELAISQYSLKSVIRCWDLCPFFRGIGYGKMVLITIFQIYYNVLSSYLLFYCISPIPDYKTVRPCNSDSLNSTCGSGPQVDKYVTNAEKFWYSEVLQIADKEDILGWPNWKLLSSFFGHMLLVYIFNIKGTTTLETMLPIAFIFSTLELLILICVTNSTPGGLEGLEYVIFKNINLNALLIWKKEGIILRLFQTYLYSMGLALGGFSSIAAQGSFRKPLYAMSIWVNFANLGTTLVYGILLANVYGIIAFYTRMEIEFGLRNKNLMKFEFDHLFTVVPNAINNLLGLPQAWKIIFYSSIYLRGLCVSSLMTLTVLNVIYEEKLLLAKHTQLVAFIFCAIITIPGFFLLTNLGTLIGIFLTNITMKVLLPIILTCEVIAVIFVYGLLRFMKDLHFMLGNYPMVYWPVCLTISMIVVPIFTALSVVGYFKDLPMTDLDVILLKVILSLVMIWIPFMCMVRAIRKVKFRIILRSARTWGPANGLKKSRKMFEEQHSVEEFLYDKYLLERKLKKYN